MKTLLCAVGAIAMLGLFGCARQSAAASTPETRPARRPNIILVTIDALRADHTTPYGYARLTSPGLERFARRAVQVEDAIAQAPYTKASVASIMTGLYPSSHKTYTTSIPFPETMTGHPATAPIITDVLPSSATTLATALRQAGYRTIAFTTNPFLIEQFGFARGFDRFRFYPGQEFASAERVVADALDTIRGLDHERPVFLWVHLMEPHSPYVPPAWASGVVKDDGPAEPIPSDVAIPGWLLPGSPRDLRRYVNAYDDEIAAADVAFDTLVRELDDLRPSRPRVIVLTSDHGEQFLDHMGWEHSSNLYDELIRVPLFISAPGLRPGLVHVQVELLDLFPTLLEFAGAPLPPSAGRSLVSVLRDGERSRPALSEIVGSQYALRSDGWKVIVANDGRVQLFDVVHDPHERRDLARTEPVRAAAMRAALDKALVRAVRWGREIRGETIPVDPAIADRLRSLGYVQ